MAADLTKESFPLIVFGLVSEVLAKLHVSPDALFYAFCGAAVGLVLSVKVRRGHALLVFPCVVFLSAIAGTAYAATRYPGDSAMVDAICGGIGLLFHPLLSAAIRRIDPKFADQMEAQQ